MQDMQEERASKRRKVRLWSLLAVVLLAVVGTVLFLQHSAAKANGGPDGEQAESGEQAADGEKKNGEKDEAEKKAPVPVEVAEVLQGDISAYISSTANLVAEDQVTILSEVEGRVSRLAVDEGDFVRRGAVLAALVRDDAEIALNKAALRETNARLAFERGEDLVGKELISREEFDRFTMDYEIAKQEAAEARWRLEKTTIRAPFSGQISGRMIQTGQNIRPGDELFQITDFDPLIARVFLPERDVLGLDEGREVRIRLNADESVAFAGRIRQISPVVDTATGTVKVTVEAVDPPKPVRPGSFVTIDIVRETRPGALLVAREAVLRELQSAHLFVIDGDAAKKRAIELGLEEGTVVEVLSGVEVGQQVIVAGQGGLKDGAKIKILDADGQPIDGDDAENESAETGEEAVG